MRKKSLNGKRVMAFVLAFSLVLGEASAVVAAPADASATCATETVAEQAPEAKTAEEDTRDGRCRGCSTGSRFCGRG